MNIHELLDFLRLELKGCNGDAFIEHALAQVQKSMENRENFNPEKFKKWFVEKNVIYKNSPLAFLTRCGIEDIEKGEFDNIKVKGFDLLPLCEDLRAKGIAYTSKDTLLIDNYLIYLHNECFVPIEELGSWLKTAVTIIANHTKNASEFRDLFRKSQSMKKLNIPYAEIEARVDEKYAEIERLLDDLEDKKEEACKKRDGNPESETKNEDQINN